MNGYPCIYVFQANLIYVLYLLGHKMSTIAQCYSRDVRNLAMVFLLKGHRTSQDVHKEDGKARDTLGEQISSSFCAERLLERC